jgi:hypothetical protein
MHTTGTYRNVVTLELLYAGFLLFKETSQSQLLITDVVIGQGLDNPSDKVVI